MSNLVLATAKQLAPGALLFEEGFESPVVVGWVEGSKPTGWLLGSNGFGAGRIGLNNEDSTDWTSPGPTDEQGMDPNYTNSGAITEEGVIGPININTVKYRLTVTVAYDKALSGKPYGAASGAYEVHLCAIEPELLATGSGSRSDFIGPGNVQRARSFIELSGSVANDDEVHTFIGEYTTDPVNDISRKGYDLAVAIVGATSSAIITSVKVELVPGARRVNWSPGMIPTIGWYDAADPTTLWKDEAGTVPVTASSEVRRWDDKSGNARHLTQAGGNTPQWGFPGVQIDGKNVIDYASTTDQLFKDGIPDINCTQLAHIGVIMGESGDWPAVGALFKTDDTDNLDHRYQSNPTDGQIKTVFKLDGVASAQSSLSDTNLRELVPIISSFWYDGDVIVTRANGGVVTEQTDVANGGTFTINKIQVGRQSNTPQNYQGELVILDTADLATIQRVEGYLAWKWGIEASLPDDHPYRDAAPTVLWTPADIDTVTWHDAAAPSTVDEGATLTWLDKSGNGNHATQDSAGSKPTYSSVEKKFTFDGGDIMKVANDPYKNLQNFAVVAIGSWGQSSENNNAFASHGGSGILSGQGWNFRQRLGLCLTLRSANDSGGSVYPPIATEFIGAGIRDASNDIYSRIDGTQSYSNNNATAVTYTATNVSAIGGVYQADNWATPGFQLRSGSTLKELVVINNATVADVEKVEGYLAHKWGLQANLPPGHPYKIDPPHV